MPRNEVSAPDSAILSKLAVWPGAYRRSQLSEALSQLFSPVKRQFQPGANRWDKLGPEFS